MEAATQKLQSLDSQSVGFKVLNAMLHGAERFPATQAVVLNKINTTGTREELEDLAGLFDKKFLKPFLSKVGRVSSNSSPSQSSSTKGSRKQSMKAQVRERDGNKCVLTGLSDFYPGTKDRQGFEVAPIVSFSLINNVNLQFIRLLVPWLPEDFFSKIDRCENAIFLNRHAHRSFGEFKWFIEMEENEDPNLNVYRVSQVVEDGILKLDFLGRKVVLPTGGFDLVSSYNQPLYIGVGSIPRPSKFFVLLHELLARIIHMRGGAKSIMEDSDDEGSVEVDSTGYQEKMFADEKFGIFDSEKMTWLFDPPVQANRGERYY